MNHIIKKQILDLEVPSGSGSWRFQNEIRDAFNTIVLPKLERVCAELDIDKDATLKIDKLLIDAGAISATDMNDSWANEIEAQFRAHIQRLQQTRQVTTGEARIEAGEQSDLSALISYLTKGVLPWWVSQQDKVSPITLLQKALDHQPSAFIAALKRAPNKLLIATRIIRQGNAQITNKIFRLLRSEEAVHQVMLQTSETLNIHLSDKHQELLKVTELAAIIESGNCNIEEIIGQWHKVIDLLDLFKVKDSSKLLNLLNNNTKNKSSLSHPVTQLLKSLKRFLAKTKHELTESKLTESRASDLRNPAQEGKLQDDESVPKQSEKEPRASSSTDQIIAPLEVAKTNTPEPQDQSSQPAELVIPKNESVTSTPTDIPDPSSELPDSVDEPVKPEQVKEGETHSPETSRKTTQNVSEQDQRVLAQIEKIKAQAIQKQANQVVDHSTNADHEEKREIASGMSEELLPDAVLDKSSEPDSLSEDIGSNRANTEKPLYPFDLTHVQAVEECYLENAGLVLFWPFLGRFFKNMGLMDSGQFINIEAQEKAAQLLQYLMTETPELEEQHLALNKLMVDLPIEHPLPNKLRLTTPERKDCDELLASVISNWSALRGTSIAGFQGSFLHRNGVLKKRENGWLLQVEKMAFDMLLEQLPWPISIVRLSWMNEPIYVEW